MARNKPHRPEPSGTEQIERALAAGRWPAALELARAFHGRQPGAESRALLWRAYQAQLDEMVRVGHTKAAGPILTGAEAAAGDDPVWLAPLAAYNAALGRPARAAELAARLPEGPERQRVWHRLADWAMAEGERARTQLPADLQPAFDSVRTAFGHYEGGRDDDARTALQAVGLQSPFLEWKIFLRGLIAYSAGDDTRAAENWQRLSADRLPTRLAGPLRYRADPAFRAAQAPAAAAALARHAARLHGGNLAEGLHQVQQALAAGQGLGPVWTQVASVMPECRQRAPALATRLGRMLYWAIVREGDERDAARYARTFGPPADDPEFLRCRALICEQQDQLSEAHRLWQSYEKWIAANPQRWPEPQGSRARSLIWEHMGQNAIDQLEAIAEDDAATDNAFAGFWKILQGRGDEPDKTPLLPPADDCFRRAAALAPDRLEPVQQLFRVYLDDGRTDAAEGVARELLERFPNDLPTLEAMADLLDKKGDPAGSLAFRRRALETNPLDRRLGLPFARSALAQARALALAGDFDSARGLIREARAHADKVVALAAACLGEAVDIKAGTGAAPAATPDAAPPAADPARRAAAVYHRAVEAGRLKLPKGPKQALEKALAELLSAGAPLDELIAVVEAVEFYRREPTAYRGLLTHEKKVWGLVEKALRADPPEADLVRVGSTLLRARAWRPLSVCIAEGRGRFPENAHFPLLLGEMQLSKNQRRVAEYRVGNSLRLARDLAQAAPDGRYRAVLEAVEQRRREHPWLEFYLNDSFDPFEAFL